MTTRFSRDDVDITPKFQKLIQEVRQNYFSRDPNLWPFYRDPGMAKYLSLIAEPRTQEELIEHYPNGEALRARLKSDTQIPPTMRAPGEIDPLLLYAAATSKQWNNPASAENVVTLPADPAIYGALMGICANANLVCREYSESAEDLEKLIVRRMAKLVGYDAEKADGLFTQGGTFCNMYGYLFGIRKSLKRSIRNGFDNANNYRFICSQGGHYSNNTALAVLGGNIEEKNLKIKMDEENRVDLRDLEEKLTACFRLKCAVPTIMLTMGTTDTFGVDCVKPTRDLVDRLCRQFNVETPPHIHVDSAVGWAILFFLDYDFNENPLDINHATILGLRRHVELFKQLKYADSFAVDFHKWGYAPYPSSLIMVKDKDSFKALEHDPEQFSYFERSQVEHYHLQSTIEASRSAVGVFAAFAALEYLGVQGYQTLIANSLQNAAYFCYRLKNTPGATLLAPHNDGPSATFRLYDPKRVQDPEKELAFELANGALPQYKERLEKNSNYHRADFIARGKQILYTNWVEYAAHTKYDQNNTCARIPGEKAVFFNPLITPERIDDFFDLIINRQNQRND
ncbi:MAG: pyridoxal-dependent decarboxylase [Planctomycetia bacterium]|nr:pyridoxal-dependent decarboxylase [Planctomycetia bacterium]